MLAAFIGKNWMTIQFCSDLQPEYLSTDQSRRPELDYYTAQSKLLDAQKSSLDAQLKPKVSAFCIGHVPQHGVLADAQLALCSRRNLSWNIAPLYTRKNDLHHRSPTAEDWIQPCHVLIQFLAAKSEHQRCHRQPEAADRARQSNHLLAWKHPTANRRRRWRTAPDRERDAARRECRERSPPTEGAARNTTAATDIQFEEY